MRNQQHALVLFADYFQFYVCDAEYTTDTGVLWDDVTTDRMLAVGSDLIAIGTARNMAVPVMLELASEEPADDFADWDQIIDCAVCFSSGKIIAFGCTENPDDAARFVIEPGSYRARVSYGALNDLSADGFEGRDHYRVQLWPGAPTPIAVIKRRPEQA